jgi:hypothetical protein
MQVRERFSNWSFVGSTRNDTDGTLPLTRSFSSTSTARHYGLGNLPSGSAIIATVSLLATVVALAAQRGLVVSWLTIGLRPAVVILAAVLYARFGRT